MPEDFDGEPATELRGEQSQVPRSKWNSALAFFTGIAILAVLIYFGIAQGMAALVMFPGIPLVLLWFIYWFFLRRLIRMRRMRSAEERRLLREAALRRQKQ